MGERDGGSGSGSRMEAENKGERGRESNTRVFMSLRNKSKADQCPKGKAGKRMKFDECGAVMTGKNCFFNMPREEIFRKKYRRKRKAVSMKEHGDSDVL